MDMDEVMRSLRESQEHYVERGAVPAVEEVMRLLDHAGMPPELSVYATLQALHKALKDLIEVHVNEASKLHPAMKNSLLALHVLIDFALNEAQSLAMPDEGVGVAAMPLEFTGIGNVRPNDGGDQDGIRDLMRAVMIAARPEGLMLFLKASVTAMGRDTFTKPDDDWASLAVLLAPIEPLEHGSACQMGFAKINEIPTQFQGIVIGKAAEEAGATCVGFINSAWVREFTPEKPPKGLADLLGSAADAEDRVEKLVVMALTADEVFAEWAPILRDGEQPPGLGDWEDISDVVAQGGFSSTNGDLIGPVVAALTANKEGSG